ncbi:MAG: serine/threonine-protein phosphatase [Anaerolineae bacterium]|nr:serine/threonine-protein phosphatase [Anaerolineae bacterium]
MKLIRRLFGQQAPETPSSLPSTESPEAAEDSALLKETQPLSQSAQPVVQTRRLTPPKSYSSTNRRVRVGAASDIGGRGNNEDAALTLITNTEVTGNPPPVGIFMVADGMGGHQNGEFASSITVRTVAQAIIREVIMPQLEERDMNSADQKTIPEVLAEAMSAANTAVQLEVPGGGTTATCAVIRADLAYVAHVGDSRAYLITDGNLELITRDHLLVRRLQELGQLTAQEADAHPQRNVLYRAIGQSDTLEVDAATRRLPPSSRLLLCSDGLWGVIGDKRINEIVAKYPDPQEACDQLVAAANDDNGPDNITVVLVQMPD